jgi:NAD-dependent SIR2 family protein deacetylase
MEIKDFFGKEGIRVRCNTCKEMVFKEYGSWFLTKKTKRTEERIFICHDCQKKDAGQG